MQVDLGGRLVVPQEIASTNVRPDIVLWSRSRLRVYFIEMTVPWEALVAEAYERKDSRFKRLYLSRGKLLCNSYGTRGKVLNKIKSK